MGLSRNKVAVPEGAAGTPPFWRIRKEFLTQLGFKPSKSRNTSFLERTLSNKEEVWIETQSFFTADVYNIEKDEAECRNAGSLKPVL